MTLFVVSVLTVLVVSATCSLSEAALYSVRLPYIRRLQDAGSRAGKLLHGFKQNMEQPIAAILILNTAANTAGAAVAGAQANHLFGDGVLILFSAAFTLSVLFFSEIIPKIIGVVYNRKVARHIAIPLGAVVTIFKPLIGIVDAISKRLQPNLPIFAFPEDEVRHIAMLSAEEGSILKFEAELVKNALALDRVEAREIMTPRTVVQKLSAETRVKDAGRGSDEWTYSRIPIFTENDPEKWVGVVLSRDILNALAHDRFDTTLGELARPIDFVHEKMRGHVLLRTFLRNRRHLSGVVDEYGSVVGIVTLEDIMESVLGQEIMDEVDKTADLQALAKKKSRDKSTEGPSEPGKQSE